MALVQDDHMVQAFAADTPGEAFHIGVLPGTPRGDHDLFDAHIVDLLVKWCAIYTIAIPPQIACDLIPGKGLDHLLRGPLRCRVLGDVEVHDAASLVGEDHQDEEHHVRHGGHHKEVHRDHVLDMVAEKGLPRW